MYSSSPESPIGIFDSGVGGLSVLRAITELLPAEVMIYIADQAHVPYGPRALLEVRSFAEAITRFLLEQGVKIIVVACNAASAAALHYLRQVFEGIPFVGMEPAVKPAAEQTQTRIVGVLATPATFQGELYASVIERFANGVEILQSTCPGLVQQIEGGALNNPQAYRILEDTLNPMLARGVDTIVLGCTHYPFVIPLIQKIVGPTVRVIDPAPAVARQVGRLLNEQGLLAMSSEKPTQKSSISHRYYTTGDIQGFQLALKQLISIDARVENLVWKQIPNLSLHLPGDSDVDEPNLSRLPE